MVKVLRRILKRSYKKKQYRYERYYFEISSRFNDLIAELYGREVKVEVEKTQDGLWIRLKAGKTAKSPPDNANSCQLAANRLF